ncbi:MAG: hypothetical protein ACP5NZ_01680 [Nanobdellota archaeon]
MKKENTMNLLKVVAYAFGIEAILGFLSFCILWVVVEKIDPYNLVWWAYILLWAFRLSFPSAVISLIILLYLRKQQLRGQSFT